ncbi:MAG: hypothetical protein AABN95_06160 [Acidobacteriota bacterium]
MKKQMIYKLLLLTSIAVFFAGMSFQGQSQKKPVKTLLKAERVLPIVDFDALEQNSSELAKQRKKGSRYDRKNSQPIEESSNVTSRQLNNHWSEGMSAIPITDSDVVLIGGVLSAKANLSNDKSGVYSEFGIQVEELLKSEQSIQSGDTIPVERYGGAVRFRSGYIQRYEVSGHGMPQLGQRYLFFLKRLDNEPSFKIITAYALLRPTIMPLDGSIVEAGSQEYPFDKYQGLETSTFLQLVKATIN